MNEAFRDGLMETLTSELTELSQFHNSLWVVPATEVRREGLTSAKDAQRQLGVNLVISGSVQRDAVAHLSDGESGGRQNAASIARARNHAAHRRSCRHAAGSGAAKWLGC